MVNADCLEWLAAREAESVDAVVTDPPYELGFMGNRWDATGIAYNVDLWRQVLRVLKPGGHLLAFGGTRTYHRMACAIEDAGFDVRDSIHWIYGTGFPKSLNLGDGWGTALKPAHEPIVLARKPLCGTVAENVQAHGTGALNIDGCRIDGDYFTRNRKTDGGNSVFGTGSGAGEFLPTSGRWPANVVFSHDCPDDGCVDGCPVAELDRQSGVLKSGSRRPGVRKGLGYYSTSKGGDGGPAIEGSQGGASRFFYVAKASRKERDRGGARNVHPTVKPLALMRYLVRLVTPPGGVVLDPFLGSGTTGIAALEEGFDFVGIEREPEYAQIAASRIGAD